MSLKKEGYELIRDRKLREAIRKAEKTLKVRASTTSSSCYNCCVTQFTRDTGVSCRSLWVPTSSNISFCILKSMKSMGLYMEEKSKTMELLTKKEKENGKEMDT